MLRSRLRIAIQKKGRLSEGSLSLLARAGLNIQTRQPGDLLRRAENFPVDILQVRDDDITSFVAEGACELGIVGLNVLAEEGRDKEDSEIEIITSLGIGHCSLKIAVPDSWEGEGVSDLEGSRIATSYPNLLRSYLGRQGVSAIIVEMKGSVEVAPRLQIASVICDLVSTGATLEANGLSPIGTVFNSEAVLIRGKRDFPSPLAETADMLTRRISSVVATTGTKYIMLNAPRDALAQITKLLPGTGSPTIVPLSRTDHVAVHAVCQESVFWETLESLKSAGASGILVVPIEKMLL